MTTRKSSSALSVFTPGATDNPATKGYVDTALALKANLASPTFTGTVGGIDKSMVGLGSVDNTSDATKWSSVKVLTNTTIDATGTGNSISNLGPAQFAPASLLVASEIASINTDSAIATGALVKAYVDAAAASISTSVGPYIVITASTYGAVSGGSAATNTTAINAALAAAAVAGGCVWIPKGTYAINGNLSVPVGVSIKGPGAVHAVITTTSAIAMMTIGVTAVGAGDRYGTIEGFALEGNDVATICFDLGAVCVQRNFVAVEARNAGIGYRIDAAQNCLFQAAHARGCNVQWAVLNDAGTNTWINCELDDANSTAMIFDDDSSLPGYALAAFNHQGPCQNTFIGCLFERGTMTVGLDIVKGRYNKFYSCYFTNNGSTSLIYELHLRTNALANEFIDCQFNGQSATISGYSAFTYPVYNEGFRNALIRPTFEFNGLGTGWCAATTNTLFVRWPQLSDNYQFRYTGAGDSRKGICIVPLESQAEGTTANRPNFGPLTSPWWYYDYDLSRFVCWNGVAYVDSIGAGGGGGTGDVLGVSSSVVGELAIFSGTTGKAIGRMTGSGIVKVASGVASVVTAPSGALVGTTDTQTISGKSMSGSANTFSAIPISALTITGTPNGFKFLRDDGSWQTAGSGGTPVIGVAPTGSKNGTNTVFTVPNTYITGSTAVWLNGLRETNYTESGTAQITFSSAPLSGDTIVVDYFI